jgi:hypothetical protein
MQTTIVALWAIISKGASEKLLGLATRLVAPKDPLPTTPLSIGDNNSGNIYVFHGPVNLTLPAPQPSPSRPST